MTVLSLPAPVFTLVRRLVTAVSAFGISSQYLLSWSASPSPPKLQEAVVQRRRRSPVPGRALYYSGHGNVPQRRWISTQQASKDAEESTPERTPDTDPEPSDVLHQLLHNPVLYNPLRTPRNPIVLCHGIRPSSFRAPAARG
jgi:triacylglycerol lipase